MLDSVLSPWEMYTILALTGLMVYLSLFPQMRA